MIAAVRPRAVVFDLLTGLIDSWTLWDAVAGDAGGRRWRGIYLRNTYAAPNYRPYEVLVREAAVEAGLPPSVADHLLARYDELEPWPEVSRVLGALVGRIALAVVTNCSERLGQVAVARTGIGFDAVVTAERAGFYKPHPRPYLLALDAIGADPQTTLFVAGSAYDLYGAAAAGMPVFWHNRIAMTAPPDAPAPIAHHDNLFPLTGMVLG